MLSTKFNWSCSLIKVGKDTAPVTGVLKCLGLWDLAALPSPLTGCDIFALVEEDEAGRHLGGEVLFGVRL